MIPELLAWYEVEKRPLLWRDSSDPYRIWISETLLQQTRVDQATPYFLRFLERFPTVQALAEADQQAVLAAWEGLGYYSRARNLHAAARRVMAEHGGRIPDTYEAFRALPGVGPYTAAAVLSIAFGKPYAVLDGNVIRVASRLLGDARDVTKTAVKADLQGWLDGLIPAHAPAEFNQGMMELGSLVCTPRNPACDRCPLAAHCIARRTARTGDIPFKPKKKPVPTHRVVVGILVDDAARVLIARRPESAMLGGLWEFPGGKAEPGEPLETALRRELREELGVEISNPAPFHELRHAYSHFKIHLHAFAARIDRGDPRPKVSTELRWVPVADLHAYPFPKANRSLTEALEHAGDPRRLPG